MTGKGLHRPFGAAAVALFYIFRCYLKKKKNTLSTPLYLLSTPLAMKTHWQMTKVTVHMVTVCGNSLVLVLMRIFFDPYNSSKHYESCKFVWADGLCNWYPCKIQGRDTTKGPVITYCPSVMSWLKIN